MQFVEKEPTLAEAVLRALLRFWPLTNSQKEVRCAALHEWNRVACGRLPAENLMDSRRSSGDARRVPSQVPRRAGVDEGSCAGHVLPSLMSRRGREGNVLHRAGALPGGAGGDSGDHAAHRVWKVGAAAVPPDRPLPQQLPFPGARAARARCWAEQFVPAKPFNFGVRFDRRQLQWCTPCGGWGTPPFSSTVE